MSSAEWAVTAVTALGFSPVGLRLISAPDMATPLTTRINVTIQVDNAKIYHGTHGQAGPHRKNHKMIRSISVLGKWPKFTRRPRRRLDACR